MLSEILCNKICIAYWYKFQIELFFENRPKGEGVKEVIYT